VGDCTGRGLVSTLNLAPDHARGLSLAETAHGARISLTARLLRRLLSLLGSPPIGVQLWNGDPIQVGTGPTLATIFIKDRSALLKFLVDPEMQFGELYLDGRIALQGGDLVALLQQVFLRQPRAADPDSVSARLTALLRNTQRNTLSGSRRNIRTHYDLGNDFYRLWLDPTLAYTCAYFATPESTLAEAQLAKYDHVCRKLNLRAGDEVVELGCGWGSLAMHAASRYGARVRAFNISHEQIKHAREQALSLGLGDRVEFIEDDYRNLSSSCDAIVSVGMLEHVGRENFAGLGRLIARSLRTTGRGLIHTIGRSAPAPTNPWIERHIFPGAYIPSLREILQIFELTDMSVNDVENLRPHYARTLELWLSAFEAQRAAVTTMFDERFVRMWRLYLAGSQAAFQSGDLQLFQVLFSPARHGQLAWTRAHWYDTTRAPAWNTAKS